MNTFIHLHSHSNYSLLDGAIPLRQLVERTRKLGMAAVALTDHNGLYGAIEFYQLCKENDLKPIIGAQITLGDSSSLVLLVKNLAGYRNLCRIITAAHLRGGHLNFQGRIEDIVTHKDGLLILSSGKSGQITRLVLNRNMDEAAAHCGWMQQKFGGNFYLELQRFVPWDDFLNDRLVEIARKYDVPVVATNDVHFLEPEDLAVREVLHAIAQNTVRERVRTAGHKEQFLKAPWQMQQVFSKFPDALQNTQKISDACNLELQLGKPIFPVMEVPKNETPYSHLRELCLKGAAICYNPLTEKVKKRIDYELKIINDLGFTDYFLIVKDIVDFCHRESIPCVGRGSAAGSLVAYVLGITFADPIHFNLYFERFLNPERTDAPDIDLDICWKNRDKVLNYVYKRFGEDKTAMICTYNTFQSRAAVRDVAKTFGFTEEEIGELTREFPYMAKITGLDKNLKTIPQLNGKKIDRTFWEILGMCHRLAGFPRHLSIHSGGVIIAPGNLTDYAPLEVAGKGIVISQYDMHSIERLGLVKMDLLGVRSLSIITDCVELAKQSRYGQRYSQKEEKENDAMPPAPTDHYNEGLNLELTLEEPDWNETSPKDELKLQTVLKEPKATYLPDKKFDDVKFDFLKKTEKSSALDMQAIPPNDAKTIAMIKAGQTLGCFQLESPLVRSVLRKMQTDSVEDTVVAVALIRPGVGDSGLKDEYILRRAGVHPVPYTHPILEPVLNETYGLTIYQEQVLLIAQQVAGFSLAQGDILRRAMTKDRNPELMQSLHEQFITGARKKGLSLEKAMEVWKFLQRFTGFGFNKAHAATYGILAFQTAFLKCYFPVEHMTAVLNNHGGFYSKAVYIEECRRLTLGNGQKGIPLLPPDVNFSDTLFTKEGSAIRVGLAPVFELTEKTKIKIVQERRKRPFSDIYDFLQRTYAGEKEAETLIRCGALRSLDPSEPLLLMKAQSYFKNKRSKSKAEYLTAGIFPASYPRELRILTELEILGFGVTAHPLSLYDGLIPWENMVSSLELERYKNRKVQFTGWYVTSRLQETVTGKYMKFLSLEDKNGICEIIFFPEVYEKFAAVIRGHGPFTVVGKVQSRIKGEANLIAEKVIRWKTPKEVVDKHLQRPQLDMFGNAA